MATEITKAVQWLETNLPALKALAAEAEKLGSLRAEEQSIRNEIRSLDATRTQIRGDIDKVRESVTAAESKAAAARAAAEKVAASRLEDLQRQQQTYEDNLVGLRRRIEDQAKLHAVREAEHLTALRDMEQRGVKAAAELLKTQEKIKALHSQLAGVVS